MDGTTLLVLPAALIIVATFVYPFLYGLVLSFHPKAGGALANYAQFFSDPFLYRTIWTTIVLSVPVTLLNVVISVPIAFRVRLMRRQRLLTTILVVPITLGTVLVAQGLLNYLGPQGWFNRVLLTVGLIDHPVRLLHNYWGVFLSLLITGFPFTFLLTLSYLSGIDPALEKAAATLGAGGLATFLRVTLPNVRWALLTGVLLCAARAMGEFGAVSVVSGHVRGRTDTLPLQIEALHDDYDFTGAFACASLLAGLAVVTLALRTLLERRSHAADATVGGPA